MKKFNLLSILVSVLFIGLSLYAILKEDPEYKITTGKIVTIEEYYDPIDDMRTYTPYIDYKVNDIEYKNVEYGAYDSSMKVGDNVNVYYLPEDPSLIQAEGYKNVPYIVLTISSILLVASIIVFIKY